MKYFLIAGERSGDLHGSNLIAAIRAQDSTAEIQGWGGDLMKKAGMETLVSLEELAFMGFWEVIRNLRSILKLKKTCQIHLAEYQPDALVLIDYSGFNLRIAQWAKKRGIRVFYYIAPKVWAWNTGRVKSFPSKIDHLFCIFPFEVEFFKKHQFFPVEYVGNPLVDAMSRFVPSQSILQSKPVMALLPGSRKQEVLAALPLMLEATRHFSDLQPIVAKVSNLPSSLYEVFEKQYPNVKWVLDDTYELLSCSSVAVVTSGTATLETAWFQVPQVVVYRTSWLSYEIARRLIKVPFISLVNLVMEEQVVTELIQSDFQTSRVVEEITKLLPGSQYRVKQAQKLSELRAKLGDPGASFRVGHRIVQLINSSKQPL